MSEQTSNPFFQNIIGHQTIKEQLSQLATSDQLPQTILLSGPEQIGKTSILLDLALHISETKIQPNPWLYTNTDSDSLKIQAIRVIQSQAYMTTPFKHQIFLIKNIERLTTEAANAFLKLLEEPPQKVRFFLTTSNAAQLPETIISRCQNFQTHRLSSQEIKDFQAKYFPTSNISQELSSLVQGRPGFLASIQNDPQTLEQLTHWAKFIQQISISATSPAPLLYSKELSQLPRPTLTLFLKLFQTLIRFHPPTAAPISSTANTWAQNLILTEEAIQAIQANYNPQLTLDNLFLKLHFSQSTVINRGLN